MSVLDINSGKIANLLLPVCEQRIKFGRKIKKKTNHSEIEKLNT